MNNPAEKYCPIDGAKMYKRFNSTVWVCPVCLNKKNKEMLSRAIQKGNSKPSRFAKTSTNPRKKSDKEIARDRADKIFSRYIRLKHATIFAGGEIACKCIITGKYYSIKNIDNGHCFSRGFHSTRFEEDNCRPQNRSSNRFSGEMDHYKFIDNLKKEIGEKRFNRLELLKNETGEDTATHYNLVYSEYKTKFRELLEELNIRDPWKK